MLEWTKHFSYFNMKSTKLISSIDCLVRGSLLNLNQETFPTYELKSDFLLKTTLVFKQEQKILFCYCTSVPFCYFWRSFHRDYDLMVHFPLVAIIPWIFNSSLKALKAICVLFQYLAFQFSSKNVLNSTTFSSWKRKRRRPGKLNKTACIRAKPWIYDSLLRSMK